MSTNRDAVSRDKVWITIVDFLTKEKLVGGADVPFLRRFRFAIDQLPPVQPDGPSGPGRSREEIERIKRHFRHWMRVYRQAGDGLCFDTMANYLNLVLYLIGEKQCPHGTADWPKLFAEQEEKTDGKA